MERAVCYLSPHESRSWRLDGHALEPGEPAPGDVVVVVADFPDESYVLAKLPAMRGPDAALLRRRRLEREFPGVALAAVQSLRRRRGGEGVDAAMIAVPGGQALQDALAALAQGHALRSVTTPALLAGEWLRRAGLRDRRVLVVLPTPAGVRLMFFDDGRPTLSRLTGPLQPVATSTEIARTVQYLQNTQRVERGEAVELWFWGVDDATAVACLPGGVDVAPSASPRVAGLPDPERDGLQALLSLAADRPGRLQLAPDELRLGWLAREFDRACRIAAAASLLLAALGGAVLEWRIEGTAAATTAAVEARVGIEQGAAALSTALESRGLSLADVATLPEAERALAAGGADAAGALAVVGVGFAAQPDVVIEAVELRAAPLAGTADASVAAATSSEPGLEDTSADATVAACGAGLERTILVEFRLAAGLELRQRDAALGWVREASAGLQPWRATPAALAIGRHDPVIVTATREEANDDARWAVCLRQDAST